MMLTSVSWPIAMNIFSANMDGMTANGMKKAMMMKKPRFK